MGLRAAAVLLIAHYDRKHLDTIRKLVEVAVRPACRAPKNRGNGACRDKPPQEREHIAKQPALEEKFH